MPQMKTLKPMRYAGRSLVAGEQFEVRSNHTRLLAAVRLAEPMTQEPPEAPADEDEQPEAPALPDQDAQDEPRPKRKYKRRDMTAE